MNQQPKSAPDVDCTRICSSRQHGSVLTSAVTKRAVSDAALASFFRCTCCNFLNLIDYEGRSLLHMVASRGRKSLLEWLLRKYSSIGSNLIDHKDPESGYTAFHRSVFYGQIQSTIALMKSGANTSILDNEDMTGIDLAVMDRPQRFDISKNMPCEVYMWGANSNYTLGTGSQHHRSIPELLTLFTKQKLHIKQVCISKFHSAFVSTAGSVWTCGHGEGGRLGVATSDTHVLPSKIPISETCVQAAVGRDHTLILLQSGIILSCGLNDHHQLGQVPPPKLSLSPRQVKIRLSSVRGVYAARYHSVVFTPNALYTWGLHGGQLGHSKDKDKTVIAPKKVPGISGGQNECTIECVAVSDGATVATTNKGDIYLLHQYHCKRIANRLHNIKSVKVVGGEVIGGDSLTDQQKQVMVLMLNSVGNIYLWQDTTNQFTRCIFNTNRPLFVMEAILTREVILLTTKLGEAFHGNIMPKKITFAKSVRNQNPDEMFAKDKSKHDGSKSFNQFINKDECVLVKLKRLPNVHRAVDISCDSKGNNFAVLQVAPNSCLLDVPQVNSSQMKEDMMTLLDESSEDDLLHDIIFKVKNCHFPVHRYIVSYESEYLANLCSEPNVDSKIVIVEIENVHPIIFKQILTYMYTGSCSLMQLGQCNIKIKTNPETNETEVYENVDFITDPIFETNKKKEKQRGDKKNKDKVDSINDPVRLLQSAAKKFQVTSLYRHLDKYGWERGSVIFRNDDYKIYEPRCKFERNRSMYLWDATIKCPDGISIQAHKCILAARLDYFNGMFAHSWAESSSNSVVTLPISHKMMIPIINYLYTDDCPELDECEDFEFLGNMLVICDQFFIERLKEKCEVALSNLLTLKNVTDILQVSETYNCGQLKRCCMEYIMLNLSSLLENRSLECVSDALLQELSEYYINFNPNMCKRIITPFSESASDEIIVSFAEQYPTKIEDEDEDEILEDMQKYNLANSSKKKLRLRKTSQSENEKTRRRNESINSVNSLDLSNDRSEDVQLCLTEISNKFEGKIDGWTKVLNNNQKQQKIVQARLKAVTAAKEDTNLLESQLDNFTKLTRNESFSPSDNKYSPIQSPTQKKYFESSYKASSPTINEDDNFPELSRSPQTTLNVTIVNTKLSQKQRKRLALESKDNSLLAEELNKLNNKTPWMPQTSQVDLTPPKNPWQKIPTPVVEMPNSKKVNFNEILEDQKKQKENLSKMMTKSLALTQLEDKAIEELTRFYNASHGEEERIMVKRVPCMQMAPPQWLNKSSKNSPSRI